MVLLSHSFQIAELPLFVRRSTILERTLLSYFFTAIFILILSNRTVAFDDFAALSGEQSLKWVGADECSRPRLKYFTTEK